jgi:hypothetical protein
MPQTTIKKIINSRLIGGIDIASAQLKIKETDRSSSLKEVIVHGLNDVLFIKLDNKGIQNQYLQENNTIGINKRCDALLFFEKNNLNNLVLCELKSTTPKAIEYEKQLVNSKLIFEYFIKLASKFYHTEIKLDKITFILFKRDKMLKPLPRVSGRPPISTQPMEHFDNTSIKIITFGDEKNNHIHINDLV